MANEATLIFETGLPIPFTVADGTGIEKGTLLQLTDPMTASAADGTAGDPFAGIAATEKIASDGLTKLEVYREGIFKLTASGSIAAGDPIATADGGTTAANKVIKAATNEEDLIGTSLETATNGQTFLAELNPRGVSLA